MTGDCQSLGKGAKNEHSRNYYIKTKPVKKEHSLWTRELPIEVVEEWHNYCQDDEDLSDVEEEIS